MLRAIGLLLLLTGSLSAGEIAFEVKETAGLRRFGYPVEAKFQLPEPVDAKTGFRVVEGKQNIAQVRPSIIKDGKIVEVIADFSVNVGPYETRQLKFEYGPDVVAPDTKGDTKVEETESGYVVTIGGLRYDVPKNLLGLFRSVTSGKSDYLRPDSKGLVILYRDNIPFRAGGLGPWGKPNQGAVTRSGPRAVALRFEGVEPLRGNREVKSTIDLTFPRSKSWVRVDWSIDDPKGFVAGLGVDLNLNVTAEPALIDFGAGSYVYTTLKKPVSAWLDWRGNTWKIDQGAGGKGELFASGPADGKGPPLEGWAHVMDRQRCTAYATTDFRTDAGGEIRASGEGHFQAWKYFARDGAMPANGTKQFTFWFHFVPMPVQIGALTSPQSMQSPLQVRILPSK